MGTQKTTVESCRPRIGKPVDDEDILRTAKEVVVKFIEIGRLSPQNFKESFKEVYSAVAEAVRGSQGNQE